VLARQLQWAQASLQKQTAAHLVLQAYTVVKELMPQMRRFAMQHSMFVLQLRQGQHARQEALRNLEALLQQALDALIVQLEAFVLETDQKIFVKWATLQLLQVLQPVR
jgi:hypothetical protein